MIYHTVYKITNLINGKYYIGKHKTTNMDDGYMGSGKLLKRAIKKYGYKNFIKEILFVFDNEKQMNLTEKVLVVPDVETNYNLCSGGQGGFGYIISKGLHLSGKGKTRTSTTKEKMRQNHWSRSDKKNSVVEKYKQNRKYQPLSLERKMHQSEIMKNKFRDVEYAEQHSIRNSKPLIINNVEFKNGRDAAAHYKLTPQAIFYRLRSNKYPNWNYKKEENQWQILAYS